MPFDRDRLTKVAFIAAFVAATTTVFIATVKDHKPARSVSEESLKSMFSEITGEEKLTDYKSFFAPAKTISEASVSHP